jgi:hypothetical protein
MTNSPIQTTLISPRITLFSALGVREQIKIKPTMHSVIPSLKHVTTTEWRSVATCYLLTLMNILDALVICDLKMMDYSFYIEKYPFLNSS